MFMFQIPYSVNCYRDVLVVILQSLISFPCFSMEIILASNSDRNDPMKTVASPATQVSVFFAGMRVIGPAWPASSVSRQ